jgi:hypothetical protein
MVAGYTLKKTVFYGACNSAFLGHPECNQRNFRVIRYSFGEAVGKQLAEEALMWTRMTMTSIWCSFT